MRHLVSPAEGPVIGTVARLEHEKGVDVLIDAAPAVLARFPGTQFIVIGDGTLRQDLAGRAQFLSVDHAFRFLGHRPDAERLVSAFDVFCLTSRSEGMPNALLEALAAGRPVVATAVGGSAEVLAESSCGVLVAPERPDLVAAALLELLSHPAQARRMSLAARRLAERRFALPRMVSRYEALYERALGTAAPSRTEQLRISGGAPDGCGGARR
jgi:glycosyltransferase involved in cell wall biosynthesis